MSYLADVPYRCPKCGDSRKFVTLRELQNHLDEEHSFKRSTTPQERKRSRVFTPLSSQKYSPRRLSREHSGRLSPLTLSYNEDAQILEDRLKNAKDLENSHKWSHRVGPTSYTPVNGTISMLTKDVIAARQNQWNTADALYQSQDLLENLQLSAEQQQRQQISSAAQLKNDLEQKEKRLAKANQDLEKLTRERLKLEADKSSLAQQMEEKTGKLTNLESQMKESVDKLKQKEREYADLMKFLEGAAQKESKAREKLEDFINGILTRAQVAESELEAMKNQTNTPAQPIPKDLLNYLAHTRSNPNNNKSRTKMTNGVDSSSSPDPQKRPGSSQPEETLVKSPYSPHTTIPTHTLYSMGYGPTGASDGPSLTPPTNTPLDSNQPKTHHKAKHKSSPSQPLRSRDIGVPEEKYYPEVLGTVHQQPNSRIKPAYYRYEDESDYEGFSRRDDLDEDYSVSQSEAPNLEMLGNVSDSPNEFYHSSDEGVPDYYLDNDGILWDGSVLSQDPKLLNASTLHRTSPSGSESGGQVLHSNKPADLYANTIKARTSFTTSPKSPVKSSTPKRPPLPPNAPNTPNSENSNKVSLSTGNTEGKLEIKQKVASPSNSQLNSDPEPIKLKTASISNSPQPYNREEYIKSVKNSSNSASKPSGPPKPTGPSVNPSQSSKSNRKLVGRNLSRENSTSSDDAPPSQKSKRGSTEKSSAERKLDLEKNLIVKPPPRIQPKQSGKTDGNIIVATADVHVNPESDKKYPVPAKRKLKSDAPDGASVSSLNISDQSSRNIGSYPRNHEKSQEYLQVESSSPLFSSLPSQGKQPSLDKSSRSTSIGDVNDGEKLRQPIKKQSSLGKVNSDKAYESRPPKPPRQVVNSDLDPEGQRVTSMTKENRQQRNKLSKMQQSSVSSASPTGSLTSGEVAKITSSSVKTSFDSDEKSAHFRQLSINMPGDSVQSVSPFRIQMEDLGMMTDTDNEITLHDTGVGPSGPPSAERLEAIKKRRLQLFCVFTYLDTKTLSYLSQVCKEWKVVSRHPALWRKVSLKNSRISAKFLITISKWCKQLQSLTLEGLKPRRKGNSENDKDYEQSTRGCLEPGMEELLRVSQNSLIALKISNCDNILTERCLWEVSCYSRLLQRLCYISSVDPVGPEVLWNMGAGCLDITTLIIPPGPATSKPGRFNNKCVQLIGQFYPELKTLSIGGKEVDERGLLPLVKQCQRLQMLEFDHMTEMKEDLMEKLCDLGLKDLQFVEFTNTPVTPKAVHILSKHCRRLQRINVRISMADYFEDTLLKENVDQFKQIMDRFNSLKKRSNLSSILRIKTDAEGKQRLRST